MTLQAVSRPPIPENDDLLYEGRVFAETSLPFRFSVEYREPTLNAASRKRKASSPYEKAPLFISDTQRRIDTLIRSLSPFLCMDVIELTADYFRRWHWVARPLEVTTVYRMPSSLSGDSMDLSAESALRTETQLIDRVETMALLVQDPSEGAGELRLKCMSRAPRPLGVCLRAEDGSSEQVEIIPANTEAALPITGECTHFSLQVGFFTPQGLTLRVFHLLIDRQGDDDEEEEQYAMCSRDEANGENDDAETIRPATPPPSTEKVSLMKSLTLT